MGATDRSGAEILALAFTGALVYWRGPAPYFFVPVPDDESAAIRAASALVTYGWGAIPALARVGDRRWETSLFPKDGRYLVPIRKAIRLAEGLSEGDVVVVQLVIRA